MTRRSSDKPSTFLVVTPTGYAPQSAFDAEVHAKYRPGTVLEAVLHEPKSEPQTRLFWRALGIVVDNTDEYGTSEDLCTALKIRLGYVDSVALIGGGLHVNPRSTKSMGREEFSDFFNRCMDVISSEVIQGLDVKALLDEGRVSVGRSA